MMWSSYEQDVILGSDESVLDSTSNEETTLDIETRLRNIEQQLREIRETVYSNKNIESTSDPIRDKKEDKAQYGDWEKYTNEFPSKMMEKMGFRGGKGLGKYENGIKRPITVQQINKANKNIQINSNNFIDTPEEPNDVVPWPPNTVLITGSSTLQGVHENTV